MRRGPVTCPRAQHTMPIIVETTLNTLQEATGAQTFGTPHRSQFSRICTRPEQIEGEGDLFIALPEPGVDTQQAIARALGRGAGGVLCDSPPEQSDHEATILIVADVYRAALSWFAAVLREQDIVTLLLLGASDNGLTARTLAKVLAPHYDVQALVPPAFTLHAVFGSFHLLPETKLLVVDMPGAQAFNADILHMLSPRVVVALAGERIEPATWQACTAALPPEGSIVTEAPLPLPPTELSVPRWTFTTNPGQPADAVITTEGQTLQRTHARLFTNGEQRLTLTTPLVGHSGLRAAAAACVIGLLFDLPPETISTVLAACQPSLCRLQPRPLAEGGMLLTLCEGTPHHARDIAWFLDAEGQPADRIVILDDVRLVQGLVPGLLQKAAAVAVSALNLPSEWAAPQHGSRPTLRPYTRHTELLSWLQTKKEAAVLIVGQRGAGDLAKALGDARPTLRSRQTKGIGASRFAINLDAFAHNIHLLAKQQPERKLIMQLPADALNCGVVALATAAFEAGAAVVGVGEAAEGLALRRVGLRGPVVIFGRITAEQIKLALVHDLAITITDAALLDSVLIIAERSRLEARLHLRLALSRDMRGIHPDDLLSMVRRIVRHKFARVEGLFAEQPPTLDPANASLGWPQMQTFTRQLRAIAASGVTIDYVHLGAVGDMLHGEPDSAITAIRMREFALGISPSPYTQVPSRLRRVVQWHTTIQHIERIPEGTVINGKTLSKDRIYAHIPVGYVDGLQQGWGFAVINGQRAPVVGASDMYRSLLDVTRLTGEVSVGDTVYLIDDRLNTVEAAALRLRTDPVHVLLAIRSEKAYIAT